MADNENGTSEAHVGKYKGDWMLDQWVCSCGWESETYFDGSYYAKEEWERHVENYNSR